MEPFTTTDAGIDYTAQIGMHRNRDCIFVARTGGSEIPAGVRTSIENWASERFGRDITMRSRFHASQGLDGPEEGWWV